MQLKTISSPHAEALEEEFIVGIYLLLRIPRDCTLTVMDKAIAIK